MDGPATGAPAVNGATLGLPPTQTAASEMPPTQTAASGVSPTQAAASGMPPTHGLAGLLLLADSRLPAGGHAHSGGAEEACRTGAISGPGDLARFLRGRLATAGRVAAALAWSACAAAQAFGRPDKEFQEPGTGGQAREAETAWRLLDAEADARIASPAQRLAGRTQGRLLIRTARRIWPSPALETLARAVPDGAHHPIALGVAAQAAGCTPDQAAMAAAYTSVTGAATAAVRLLGLDPVTVHRLLAELPYDSVIAEQHDWSALPAHAAPALDLLAEQHLRTEVRLFVS
ncbi:urease accessory UreF family protein [Herbidospora sp. NBRC 101105]|uniref:urease accessory protein UreF n=1 Tax=Herbidospora sp. NBRC 101105 TaxID=3032195 RepID=UPI0024A20A34|nr:urease accessory UreF family protein [Herbidospora sp. NBRC 101105]GLX92316.1 urease accessory protein UreF [Herbidospora sp. NBRC 101105]